MTIDHEQLTSELEEKFADRFTEKDEDYARALKSKKVDVPCIYPWFGRQNWRRGGGGHNNQRNNQFNNNQRYHHQNDQQQRNEYRSNEFHHQQLHDQSGDHKRRRFD